jgi:hypothetical protein
VKCDFSKNLETVVVVLGKRTSRKYRGSFLRKTWQPRELELRGFPGAIKGRDWKRRVPRKRSLERQHAATEAFNFDGVTSKLVH